MFENGEWIEEGIIHISENEMKNFMNYFKEKTNADK
jgi:hypothetical protein